MKISVKEEKNGYFAVLIDGHSRAYGLTREQADWFMRGINHGIDLADGRNLEYTDSYYEFHTHRN